MEWIRVDSRNLPSTYQQVIRNMLYIQEDIIPVIDSVQTNIGPMVDAHEQFLKGEVQDALDAIRDDILPAIDSHGHTIDGTILPVVNEVNGVISPAVKKLNDTILNPNAGAASDVVLGEDGVMRVVGAHINSGVNRDIDAPAMDIYGRNMVVETRSTSDLGLDGYFGIGCESMTVITVIPDDAMPWQIAIGDDITGGTYVRSDNGDGTWGNWERDVYHQFIEYINRPPDTARDVGEYWVQDVYPPSEFHLQFIDDVRNVDYIDLEPPMWARHDIEDIEDGSSDTPAIEDLNLLNMIGTLSFIDDLCHVDDFTIDSDGMYDIQGVGENNTTPIVQADIDLYHLPTYSFVTVTGATIEDIGQNSQDSSYSFENISGDDVTDVDLEGPEIEFMDIAA